MSHSESSEERSRRTCAQFIPEPAPLKYSTSVSFVQTFIDRGHVLQHVTRFIEHRASELQCCLSCMSQSTNSSLAFGPVAGCNNNGGSYWSLAQFSRVLPYLFERGVGHGAARQSLGMGPEEEQPTGNQIGYLLHWLMCLPA
jgi:hypothetical protein